MLMDEEQALPVQNDGALARIAQLLGCPVEALGNPSLADPLLVQSAELIRYWMAIEHPEGRAQVVALARDLTGTP